MRPTSRETDDAALGGERRGARGGTDGAARWARGGRSAGSGGVTLGGGTAPRPAPRCRPPAPFGLAEAAEDGDDLPEDLRLVAVDRVEGGVVGEELDVAAPA